jgi:hypothetical protein
MESVKTRWIIQDPNNFNLGSWLLRHNWKKLFSSILVMNKKASIHLLAFNHASFNLI